jgi:hypothetical protein
MSNTCTCRQPQFFIPRSAFPFDEKAAFVDHVLKVLIESRFDGGYGYQLFEQPGDRAERVFHDLIDTAPWPFYALSSLGRKVFRALASVFQNAKQTASPNPCQHAAISSATLTPNLGRGSP